ncbi:TetR/AcrR family transcriptional regulator [Rummeliibacillus suwonensis]|uniref:TetR/AcrR family transcriptional regulator n=1 Tax=Rummeliibacillus suwonensis TaxID=1306154 RepID=UPI0011B69E97|nr:TetR/AcrR family transcriptional regulator [Rummeliibacillus suwonensis]
MNGFEKRAALIKEKILKTTLKMLQTYEPSQLRIADIAKIAKVSQVTIYNYFGSKDALIHESVKRYIDVSIQDFQVYMQQEDPIKEKIERMLLQNQESYGVLSPSLIKRLIAKDEEIASYIQEETKERIIPLLVQMIDAGKKNGEISKKITAEGFLVFINFMNLHYEELLDIVTQQDNTDLIDSLHHIFFYGICGKE